MSDEPLVLVVDDDEKVRAGLRKVLEANGFRVATAADGEAALLALHDLRPAVILLDVLMPGMDGFQVSRRLQEEDELRNIPIIFLTGLGSAEDRARAFAAGATDFVAKPFEVAELLDTIRRHIDSRRRWKSLKDSNDGGDWLQPTAFLAFKRHLEERVDIPPEAREVVQGLPASGFASLARILGMSSRELAQHAADFLDVPIRSGIDPQRVRPGLLPTAFCRANQVVPVEDANGAVAALVANPFDWQLLDEIRWNLWGKSEPRLEVAEPAVVQGFYEYGSGDAEAEAVAEVDDLGGDRTIDTDEVSPEGLGQEVMKLANELLRLAVADRASDIHLEPKGSDTMVRFRVDGDLQGVRQIPAIQGTRLISRFKALGGLDIAERRKPQDGALEATIDGRRFKLRLATAATPHGESLVIRVLEPGGRPPTLHELGMTEAQTDLLQGLARRSQGLMLVVGPTGSGKSTTIFSLLSGIDGTRRSIVSVEDPVEYRIPQANQQQVDEKAGATFEALLRSAVRQDPDVLLLGEIRDLFSAKAALDFSSSGHLCVTTIHSSNSTTAVFRLERLGIERGAMADAILAIVAQQLLRKLCDRCRTMRPIRDDEREILARFTDEVPAEVGDAAGCPRCRGTGTYGRVGVYEVLEVDPDLARMIRGGAAISEMRELVQERGNFLISHHALTKVRDGICSVDEVHRRILVEERARTPKPAGADAHGVGAREWDGTSGDTADRGAAREAARDRPVGRRASGAEPDDEETRGATILVVEDQAETRLLIQRYLENDGHEVVLAEDGTEALLALGSRAFDLVLSDINMPNLDGLKLLEVMGQKGVDVPVVFLTARTEGEVEVRGLELGAADYLKKPVEKQLLRLRVERVLERRR
ncbi:MAG: ATPase, T2SS/T4P/T4SS family [Longimicrobiales bacterium]|nr:ATPase, T2SS/T4P/T4SS family [Longimicrobiales bacterium]